MISKSYGTDRKRVSVLILVMFITSTCVTGVTFFILYRAALVQQRERLSETAKSWARLIEEMGRFDRLHRAEDVEGGVFGATMSQVRAAYKRFEGFGKSGEFTLARRVGEQIVFLLRRRHTRLQNPIPVSFSSPLAEPMRRALHGESGTIVGLDYRGEKVLAAYEPVDVLDLGIVAKIDLAEIHAPFLHAGRLAASATLLLVTLGAMFFLKISNPLLSRIEANERRLNHIFESVPVSIWEENSSEVRSAIADLKSDGVEDFAKYMDSHPEFVSEAVRMVKVVDVNQQSLKMFGATSKRELLTSLEKTLLPETFPVFARVLAAYAQGEHLFESEAVVQTLAGERRDILLRIALPNRSAESRSLVSMMDITTLKRTEEALSHHARRQEALADLGRKALTCNDLTELFNEVVRLGADVLGVEYCKILQLLPQRDALLLRAGVGWEEGRIGRETVPIGENSQAEYTLRYKTPVVVDDLNTEKRFRGAALLVEHQVVSGMSVLIGDAENPFGVLGAHTIRHRQFTRDEINFLRALANILAATVNRSEVEVALRLSEGRYRELVETIRYGIGEIDLSGTILFANEAYHLQCGYPRGELLGKNILDMVATDSERESLGDYLALLSSEQPPPTPYIGKIRTRNGEVIDIQVDWTYRRNTEGQVTGFIAVITDISTRKKTESALNEHREHLEELVRERTADLRKTVNMMGGREVRMAELKVTINKLRAQLEEAGMTPVADDPLRERGVAGSEFWVGVDRPGDRE